MDTRYSAQAGVRLISRKELAQCPAWQNAFSTERKDHRHYELLEDTLRDGYDYRYLAIADETGATCAIQPCFLLDQDLVAGSGDTLPKAVTFFRRFWPRFLKLRTLMIGSVAGEGHLDGGEGSCAAIVARLASGMVPLARAHGASLIVFKEFPARYRPAMKSLLARGYGRIPSLPMTRLAIDYRDFDDYVAHALNGATRRKLRKKFRATDTGPPITMSIVADAAAMVDEIYPLYLAVYERSKLHFEKLTKEYFRRIGALMPDKTRFFLWRREGKIVAFTLCLLDGDALFAEYIGLDYGLALELHLYHYAVRDMTSWAIAHGYKWFRSSGLNYDPKLHLRHVLDPIDLYVRHTSAIANWILRRALPLMEPTRNDPVLKLFANYPELWG
jgi:hypothetical protein